MLNIRRCHAISKIALKAGYCPYSFSGSTWTGGAGAKKLPNKLDRLVALVGVTDGACWVLVDGACEVVVLLLLSGDLISECKCRTGGGLRGCNQQSFTQKSLCAYLFAGEAGGGSGADLRRT